MNSLGATDVQAMARYNLQLSSASNESQVAFRAFGMCLGGAVLGFLILGRRGRSGRSAAAFALPVLGVGGIWAFQHYQYTQVVPPP